VEVAWVLLSNICAQALHTHVFPSFSAGFCALADLRKGLEKGGDWGGIGEAARGVFLRWSDRAVGAEVDAGSFAGAVGQT